jgi:general secretion pathway protein E
MTETQSDLIHEWLGNIQGLFLVVGAVGSGKSTTLYALLNQLRKRTRSVVTIEDPVEYRIEGVNQIQVSPSTDFDFPEALKSVMRLDPDDIMFGEIRDPVSAAAAIDVRKLCDSCKKETSVSDSDKAWLKSIGRKAPKNLYEANPGGCEACGGVGYKGRTGIFEVWRLRQKDKELLIQHPAEQALRQQIRDWGLPSLFDASWDLLTTGTTSLEEIRPLSGLVAGED